MSSEKSYDELTIQDNFIFTKVMEQKKLMIQLLKRIFPNEDIGDIELIKSENTMEVFYQSKGIRVDVFSETKEYLFSVEMQVEPDSSLPKRARYQESILNVYMLQKGKRYKELKNAYVIFICPTDPFNDKLVMYNYRNVCLQTGKELDDGVEKIFINCSGVNKEEYPELMPFVEYVKTNIRTKDQFVCDLDDEVNQVKLNPLRRKEYMDLQAALWDAEDRGREEGREEGRKEGREEGGIDRTIDLICRKMNKGMSFNEACDVFELTADEIEACRKRMEASSDFAL